MVITGTYSLEEILVRGAERRKTNLLIAQARVDNAREYTVLGLKISVAIGGSPIVDSCILLSKKTGVGMLVRYDEKLSRTFVSCRVTEESGYNAGELMLRFINGGGSKPMGGGSLPGILTLEELFKQE